MFNSGPITEYSLRLAQKKCIVRGKAYIQMAFMLVTIFNAHLVDIITRKRKELVNRSISANFLQEEPFAIFVCKHRNSEVRLFSCRDCEAKKMKHPTIPL